MSALAAIALNAGLPILEKILTGKLGDTGGALAVEVLAAIAKRAGVAPEDLEEVADRDPGVALDAMRKVEVESPLIVGLYAAGLQGQFALLQAETEEGGWKAAWRPAGMYMLGFLWLWNVVVLHVANAVWKVALPPMPFDQLLQVSGLYMGLYMGGHTVKDIASKWVGK